MMPMCAEIDMEQSPDGDIMICKYCKHIITRVLILGNVANTFEMTLPKDSDFLLSKSINAGLLHKHDCVGKCRYICNVCETVYMASDAINIDFDKYLIGLCKNGVKALDREREERINNG